MTHPPAPAEAALRKLQESFASAAPSACTEPPTSWGEATELQRRFPVGSPDVLNLNELCKEQLPLLEGSVCRFLCHVQQPLNAECFVGAVYRDGFWESSKYRDSLPATAAAGSKSVLWSRQAYRCSLIPGATAWWQQKQQQQKLALRECVVLYYHVDGHMMPRLNDVIEVVGFGWGGSHLAVDQFVAAVEDCYCGVDRYRHELESPEEPHLLRLHAFFLRQVRLSSPELPVSRPQDDIGVPQDLWKQRRRRVVELLENCFDGDTLAAEYGLLALCSRPIRQQQKVDALSFHRLRVNFVKPQNPETQEPTLNLQEHRSAAEVAKPCAAVATSLADSDASGAGVRRRRCVCPLLTHASRKLLKTCRELVPCAIAVSVHPEALLKNRLSPHLQLAAGDGDDLLTPAPLQLPPGCVVVVDEPQSLERCDLELTVRRRAAAATAAARAAAATAPASTREHEEPSAGQKSESNRKRDEVEKQQQHQEQVEVNLLQQEVGASISAMQMLIADGSVPYDFLTGMSPIATDCSVLLFTHRNRVSHFDGLALVPLLTVDEAGAEAKTETQSKAATRQESLDELRQLISAARQGDGGVQLHPKLHDKAVADFVRKRQQDGDISSDDFQLWLVVAASVAASYGSFINSQTSCREAEAQENRDSSDENSWKVLVDIQHWEHAQQLEDERRRRVRTLRRVQDARRWKLQLQKDAASLAAAASELSLS